MSALMELQGDWTNKIDEFPSNLKSIEEKLPVNVKSWGEANEREVHQKTISTPRPPLLIRNSSLRIREKHCRLSFPTSVWSKIRVVERFAERTPGRDLRKASTELLRIYGRSKRSVLSKWMRAHSNIPIPVLELLSFGFRISNFKLHLADPSVPTILQVSRTEIVVEAVHWASVSTKEVPSPSTTSLGSHTCNEKETVEESVNIFNS